MAGNNRATSSPNWRDGRGWRWLRRLLDVLEGRGLQNRSVILGGHTGITVDSVGDLSHIALLRSANGIPTNCRAACTPECEQLVYR